MVDENIQLPSDQSIDYHIVTLFQRLETIRKGTNLEHKLTKHKHNMQAEIRTLEFWRSIIAECLASFLYVFIVCGAAAGAGVGASVSSVLLATALASGFAVATITQCFSHISGAHINPSVTLAMVVIRAISPLRAIMYITAQCGGGIAGAALLYGVTVPGYQGNLQAAISQSASLAAWERLGVELILTFIVVLAYFMSTDSYKQFFGSAPLSIGAAYSACSFVSMPYLNPARSLGPSFVLNKWENHWVYWFGPLIGGALSGLVYKYIFHTNSHLNRTNDNMDNDSLSIQSDDDINYDLDLDKPSQLHHHHHQQQQQQQKQKQKQHQHQSKFHNSTYRSGALKSQNVYSQNLYSTTLSSKLDTNEPVYGGTRSMYCKSPPLTRANLNRSQSVYAKSNSAVNRELGLRPGPLIPAQSLYPIRISQTQNSHVQNQNVQNQLQQRSDSIYGIRNTIRGQERPQQDNQSGFQSVYGTRINPSPIDGLCKYERNDQRGEIRDDTNKFNNHTNRPESIHAVTQSRRGQSTQSDDSSYGSYHGPPTSNTPPSRIPQQNIESVHISGTNASGIINSYPNGQQQQQQPHQLRNQQNPERKISNSSTSDRQYKQIQSNGISTSNTLPSHSYNIHSIRTN